MGWPMTIGDRYDQPDWDPEEIDENWHCVTKMGGQDVDAGHQAYFSLDNQGMHFVHPLDQSDVRDRTEVGFITDYRRILE